MAIAIENDNTKPIDVDFDSISVLIPKFKGGDENAREQLLVELQGFLTTLAEQNLYGDLKQKVGASDIVQLSFLRVVEQFEQFKGTSKGEFFNWLRTIVVNEINNTNRSFKTKKRDVRREQKSTTSTDMPANRLADSNLTPSSANLAAERIEVFRKVLNELTPEHAEVIQLRSFDELAFKEIGQRMNRSEDAVQKLWFRAMQKLEDKLKNRDLFESQ